MSFKFTLKVRMGMFRAVCIATLCFGIVVLIAVISTWVRRSSNNNTAAKECTCTLVHDAQMNVEKRSYVAAQEQLRTAVKLMRQHNMQKLKCSGITPGTMLTAVTRQVNEDYSPERPRTSIVNSVVPSVVARI